MENLRYPHRGHQSCNYLPFGETIKRQGLDSLIEQLAERNRNGEVELPATIAKPFKGKADSTP